MAFGLLTNKFQILKTPLQRSLKNNSDIIMSCAILHNYIIDQDGTEDNDTSENTNEISGDIAEEGIHNGTIDIDDLPSVNGVTLQNHNENPSNMVYTPCMVEEGFEEMNGVSMTRMALVEFLDENDYSRPNYNVERNKERNDIAQIADEINGQSYGQEYYHPN